MIQKHKKLIVFTLIFSFLLLGTGVFINKNSEAQASDGEMLTMLRGMNQVLGLIAERLSPFNVDNGNVGIGTTDPATRLHIRQLSDTGDGGLRISRGNNLASWSQWVGSDAALHFGYGNPAEATPDMNVISLRNSGNVGIGTTSPSRKLSVDSGSTNYVAEFTSADTTSLIGITDPEGTVVLLNYANGEFRLRPGSITADDALVVKTNGNVGIGATNPQENLHVAGNLKVDGNIIGGSPVKFADDIEVDGKVCLEGVCLDKDELKKLKDLITE